MKAKEATKAIKANFLNRNNSFPLSCLAELALRVSPLGLISAMVSARDSDAAVEARVDDLSLADIMIEVSRWFFLRYGNGFVEWLLVGCSGAIRAQRYWVADLYFFLDHEATVSDDGRYDKFVSGSDGLY